jgi:uncharacterized protein (TIGR03067 family)
VRGKHLVGVGILALGVAFVVRADEKGGPTKAPNFVGDWTIVAGERAGEKEPEERIKGTAVHSTADTITVTDKNDKETYVATYKIDLGKKPHPILMTAKNGPDKGQTARGIIQLQGDTLKLCYAVPGNPAPADFATKKGENQLLFVMKKR